MFVAAVSAGLWSNSHKPLRPLQAAPETQPLNLVAPAAEQAPPVGVPKPDHLPQPLASTPEGPAVGVLVTLPVSASTQESSAVALAKEVVPTGTLPPPPERGIREKKRDVRPLGAMPLPVVGAPHSLTHPLVPVHHRRPPFDRPTGPTSLLSGPPRGSCASLASPAQVAARFATQLDVSAPSRSAGLTAAEAARRLTVYGANLLTPPP